MRKLLFSTGIAGVVLASLVACSGAKDDGITTGSPSSSSGATSSGSTSSGATSSGSTSSGATSSGATSSGMSSGTSSGMSSGGSGFSMQANIGKENTCNGPNNSPAVTWSGAPQGTQSFVLVLQDTTDGTTQWVIGDILPSVSSLPAGVEKTYMPTNALGAHQTVSGYDNNTRGYFGPCPRDGTHDYSLTLYALDTVLAIQPTTKNQNVEQQIKQHTLANAFITAKWTH